MIFNISLFYCCYLEVIFLIYALSYMHTCKYNFAFYAGTYDQCHSPPTNPMHNLNSDKNSHVISAKKVYACII